jgi:ATP-dependent Clp protease protease subunit
MKGRIVTRNWFRVEATASSDTADIYVYSEIGESFYNDRAVTGQKFIDDLNALPATVKHIHLRINSPGGSVFDAVAIVTALREQQSAKGRTVTAHIDGLAASAASVLAMAASSIRIADNALIMIHEPYTIEMGTADDMRKTAERLDKVRDTIVTTYQAHAKGSADEIRALMAAETWMDADEAIAKGFATEKVGAPAAVGATATFRPAAMARFRNVPDAFRARLGEVTAAHVLGRPADALAVMDACRGAGVELELAADLVRDGATLAQANERIAVVAANRAVERARIAEVTAACDIGRVQQLAKYFIAGGISADQAGLMVCELKAMLDKAEIDAGIDPDQGVHDHSRSWTRAFKDVDATRVYAERNAGGGR